MRNFFRINNPRIMAVLASVLVLSLSAGYIALAWTEPTGTMPVTVAAPLNTGGIAQTKAGSLAVQGNLTASIFYDADNTAYYVNPAGQTLLAGSVGVGTGAPSVYSKFHILQSSYGYQDSVVESALPSFRLVDNEDGQSSFGFLADGSNLYLDAYTYADRFANSYGSHILTIQSDGKVVISNGGQLCIGTSCVASSTWATIASGAGSSSGPLGGTGADGAFSVTSGVTTLTLGHVYNFSSFNISSGATLAFTGTGPALINVSGNATIAGTIELRGLVTSGSKPFSFTTSRGDTVTSGNPVTIFSPNNGGAGGFGGWQGYWPGGNGGTSISSGNGSGGASGGGAGSGGNSVTGGGGGGGNSYNATGLPGSSASGFNGGNGGNGAAGTSGGVAGGGGGGGGYNIGNGGNGGAGGGKGGGGAGGSSGVNGGSGGSGGKGGKGSDPGNGCETGPGGNGGWGYANGGNGGNGDTCQSSTNGGSGGDGGNGGDGFTGIGGAGGSGGDATVGNYGSGGIGGNGGNGGAGRLGGGNGGNGGAASSFKNSSGGNGGNGGNGTGAAIPLVMYVGGTVNFTGTINAQSGNGGNGGNGGSASYAGGTILVYNGNGGNGGNGEDGADIFIISKGTATNSGTISNSGGIGGIGGRPGSGGIGGYSGYNGKDGRDGITIFSQILSGM